jgi:hypothetical protein
LRRKCQYSYEENTYAEYAPIEEMRAYISALELKREELDSITELCFDGGEEIYVYLLPDWDGESDFFDVKSVEGFECLRNLKTVEYISMAEEEVLLPMRPKDVQIR